MFLEFIRGSLSNFFTDNWESFQVVCLIRDDLMSLFKDERDDSLPCPNIPKKINTHINNVFDEVFRESFEFDKHMQKIQGTKKELASVQKEKIKKMALSFLLSIGGLATIYTFLPEKMHNTFFLLLGVILFLHYASSEKVESTSVYEQALLYKALLSCNIEKLQLPQLYKDISELEGHSEIAHMLESYSHKPSVFQTYINFTLKNNINQCVEKCDTHILEFESIQNNLVEALSECIAKPNDNIDIIYKITNSTLNKLEKASSACITMQDACNTFLNLQKRYEDQGKYLYEEFISPESAMRSQERTANELRSVFDYILRLSYEFQKDEEPYFGQ